METETNEITREDLWQYYKTLTNKCKVRIVRSRIYNAMPKSIKDEFQTKINDLEEIEFGTYVIRAKDGSEQLNKFLGRFLFKLVDSEKSSPEINASFTNLSYAGKM